MQAKTDKQDNTMSNNFVPNGALFRSSESRGSAPQKMSSARNHAKQTHCPLGLDDAPNQHDLTTRLQTES